MAPNGLAPNAEGAVVLPNALGAPKAAGAPKALAVVLGWPNAAGLLPNAPTGVAFAPDPNGDGFAATPKALTGAVACAAFLDWPRANVTAWSRFCNTLPKAAFTFCANASSGCDDPGQVAR